LFERALTFDSTVFDAATPTNRLFNIIRDQLQQLDILESIAPTRDDCSGNTGTRTRTRININNKLPTPSFIGQLEARDLGMSADMLSVIETEGHCLDSRLQAVDLLTGMTSNSR